MADLRSDHSNVAVGQIWEDTYLTGPRPWTVKVMKLNAKSARVEPCSPDGWYEVAGYEFQHRMEFKYFDNGRMRLVKDTTTDEKIRPVITGTYGDNGMARALVAHLAIKIDEYDHASPNADLGRMIRNTCWDWFSGGTTADSVAQEIIARLGQPAFDERQADA